MTDQVFLQWRCGGFPGTLSRHGFSTTFSDSSREHGLGGDAPFYGADGFAAECAGRRECSEARRATGECFICESIHEPAAAREENVRIGWVWDRGRDRSGSPGMGLRAV